MQTNLKIENGDQIYLPSHLDFVTVAGPSRFAAVAGHLQNANLDTRLAKLAKSINFCSRLSPKACLERLNAIDISHEPPLPRTVSSNSAKTTIEPNSLCLNSGLFAAESIGTRQSQCHRCYSAEAYSVVTTTGSPYCYLSP